jgi:general L-amino acid transport system permease protein
MSDQSTNPVSYVREGMLPEQAPPVGETGAIKWVRENLLSSPLNIILTAIALYVIYSVLAGILPWLSNSIWNANSLSECREILAAKGLSSHDGGCFAVIKHRWHQLIFGAAHFRVRLLTQGFAELERAVAAPQEQIRAVSSLEEPIWGLQEWS